MMGEKSASPAPGVSTGTRPAAYLTTVRQGAAGEAVIGGDRRKARGSAPGIQPMDEQPAAYLTRGGGLRGHRAGRET